MLRIELSISSCFAALVDSDRSSWGGRRIGRPLSSTTLQSCQDIMNRLDSTELSCGKTSGSSQILRFLTMLDTEPRSLLYRWYCLWRLNGHPGPQTVISQMGYASQTVVC
jgi:hypothetical protein